MSTKRIQQKGQLLPHHMETLSESVQVDATIVGFAATDGFLDTDRNTCFWRHFFPARMLNPFFCELVNMSPRQLASTDKNVNEKKIVYKRTRHIDMRIVHTLKYSEYEKAVHGNGVVKCMR